jgi:signal transduction histidine kinase
MIKQLKIKFITVTMILVAVMLLSIFVVINQTTFENFREDNLRILKGLDRPADHKKEPDKLPQLPNRIPNMCFVLTQNPDGSLQVASGYDTIPDAATLQEIFAVVTDSEDQTGILYHHKLRFYKLQNADAVSIAFMDVSKEMSGLLSLGLNCVIIWFVALAVFFPISIFLARVITHPVELAMAQQQQFVADASHELKTPLTVILTNSELLQSAEYSPQEQQRFIDAIHTMAVQMRHLVANLLDLARLDQGGNNRQYATLEISSLAEECGMLFESVYFEAGRKLVYHIEPVIYMRGDGVKLRQLIDILLDNGCKYSEVGSQVTLQLHRQGVNHCLLQVSSRGQSLTSQQCQDIFKRFYRVDTVRTGSGSYGLGLPIAQQITQEHRGKIWCDSKDGVNTFYVQLPTDNRS